MWDFYEIDTLGDTPGSIGGSFGGGSIGGSFNPGGGQISGSGSGSAGYSGGQAAAIAQQQAAAAQQQAAYYAQMQALYGDGWIDGGFNPVGGGGNGSMPFIGTFDGGTVYANGDGTNTGSNFLGNLGLGAGISTPIALLGAAIVLLLVLKK